MRHQQTHDQEVKCATTQTPIAVVGLACRLPGDCNTPVDFWKFLLESGCASCDVPPSRFNVEQFYDASLRPNTMRSPGGMFINVDPKDLDAGFFGLSQTDAISMDPNQRQLLEVVYEGLENAGLKLESLQRKRYGCFVGSYASDYSDMQNRDPEDRTPSFTIGAGRAMLSNRISHFLDITGPSMTIDTACSGSLISVDLACRYLDSRDADGAIVAGCNLYLNPEHNMEQSAMDAAASRTGRCWTFDARADGYIKAEAINTIVLKRLDDAIRDGDPIRAVIRGSSTNSDGWTPGIANPSSDAQAVAIKQAYARAGISQLSGTAYLECHGTGTQAGDPIEVTAASVVFAPDRSSPLRIGSVKSNIGHSEPAAGISGMLKTILSIENGVIPGNPTFEVPNPSIDFAKLKMLPSRAATPWPLNMLKRASVNSFGYGGSNAHVVVEHPDVLIPGLVSPHVSSYLSNEGDLFALEDEEESDKRRLFVFSANDDTSLRALTKSYVQHLSNPAVSVEPIDLAYTLSERRTRHFHRAFAISRDAKLSEGQFSYGKPRSTPPRIGFVFTGQGAQWSQMGKELLEAFDIAQSTVSKLDRALEGLQDPPPWSLYNELVQRRTTDHMRSPEFSQPLVTALQLALFDVLATFGLRPTSVIGHSSGEIAAAAVSGRLTYEEAIKVAYLRGKLSTTGLGQDLGMLAVGLSEDDVRSYTKDVPHVQVACINSPVSVTLSGKASDLDQVRENVQADGHFARLLHVDMAYHSGYMEDVARKYLSALRENCPALGLQTPIGTTCPMELFSTVSGRRIDRLADAEYWHDNMICPVRFSEALEHLITENVSDTLVELGPSGALAGPISQVKVRLQRSTLPIEYFTSLSRGDDSLLPLYDLLGRMFLAGADIDLMRVNGNAAEHRARVIVDLPNYPWNHTVKYWHEPLASLDWRYRKFLIHDLLGSKILGTSWQMPSWRRILRLKELPWLRDHQISSTIIFPAAGYIAMAVEAVFQTSLSTGLLNDVNNVSDATYDLRNVRLLRALVLEEDKDHHLYFFLNSTQNVESAWFHFSIQHLRDGTWTKHADGMVRIRSATQPQLGPSEALSSFEYPIKSAVWYQALEKVGFNFGPAFQNVLEYETRTGAEMCRARLAWPRKQNLINESDYAIHPTIIDSFFQAGCPSVYRYRTSIDRAIVPKVIDDITIFSRRTQPISAIASSRCIYTGSGRQNSIPSRASHAEVYDGHTSQLLFKLAGLNYSEIDPPLEFRKAHDYMHLSWMPDISTLLAAPLESLPVTTKDIMPFSKSLKFSRSAAQMLLLAQHKFGLLSLLDIDFATEDSDKSSTLHDREISEDPAFSRYVYTSTSAQGLASAQARMASEPSSSFFIHDVLGDRHAPFTRDTKFDVVVVRLSLTNATKLKSLLVKAKSYATDRGFILLIQSDASLKDFHSTSTYDGSVANAAWDDESTQSVMSSVGLRINLRTTYCSTASSNFLCSKHVLACNEKLGSTCSILNLSDRYDALQLQSLRKGLQNEGISVSSVSMEQAANHPAQDPILLLDHPATPLLETIDEQSWSKLQKLLGSNCRVLYVSCGWNDGVMLPGASLFTGLARTVRSEDPTVMIKTLELSSTSLIKAVAVISQMLRTLSNANENTDHEFCERNGILYVSRLYIAHAIIEADFQEANGRLVQKKWFHANPHIVRMKCSQVGTLDSLRFFEVNHGESELREDCIEVEIRAAALNFKDLATSAGLVAEDEYRLGSDGAGIVRRVGAKVTQFGVGDRVITLCKGTFANRVQAEPERCLMMPSSMSFEEAATIPIVFFTVVYALLETTKLQQGQSILIHSAAGGIGIASIQLCRYLGAKIYATVGSEEKHHFLTNQYGLPPNTIFSSRSSDFYQQIMEATNGRGVDIVLNSLSGDLLAESWRCLADNGTLIEIGKKDIVERRSLPMEPFNRNCTYRAIDIAQPSIYFDFDLIKRVMSTILHLVEAGFLKPIQPRKRFSFGAISEAMKYMRRGTHIGKIVFSDNDEDIEIPVELASRTLCLERNSTYLIIGGLKGLCGSLAVFLAQNGAKHMIVMSRSGADDDESRAVIKNVTAVGASIAVVKGDVTIADDVSKAFRSARYPIRGIIQGAMVLRDSTFEAMKCSDYHAVIAAKVRGTWNLHHEAQSQSIPLQFFTLLSSISGIVGSGGQANYAAGNAFLDAFAMYRHNLSLRAHSVNLGVIEEVGYMSKHMKTAERVERRSGLVGIDERTLHKIVKMSILQQIEPIGTQSQAQMITGLSLPLRQRSELLRDARFCTLRGVHEGDNSAPTNGANNMLALLQQMLHANVDPEGITMEAVRFINDQVVRILGLAEAIEPAKSLNSYGIDSLAAVDLRNWLRTQLKVDLSTWDILHAKSLVELAGKVTASLRNGS